LSPKWWKVDVSKGIQNIILNDTKGRLRFKPNFYTEQKTEEKKTEKAPNADGQEKKDLMNSIFESSGAKNKGEFLTMANQTIKQTFGEVIAYEKLDIKQLKELSKHF